MKDLGIGGRLKKLRRKSGLSQTRVAQKLFVTQAAYSFMEGSQHGLSSEHIIQLCRLYDVTADFLLLGNKNLVQMTTKNGFLPLLNEKAHAGILSAGHEQHPDESFEYYKIPGYNPTKDSVLIQIEGDSMQPTVLSGDVLICQPQENLEYVLDRSIVVLITDEGLLTKRIIKHINSKFFWLESDNPDDNERQEILKSNINKLYMVMGKCSKVLVPHTEMAFKGRIQAMQESVKALEQEVYSLNKKFEGTLDQSSD